MQTFDWRSVSTAVVIGVLTAVASYLSTLANLTNFDWQALGVIAFASFVATLAKQLGTTQQGNFAGAVPVK